MVIQITVSEWLSKEVFNQSSLLTKVIAIHALSLPFYIIIHISAFATQGYKLLKFKIFVSEIQNPSDSPTDYDFVLFFLFSRISHHHSCCDICSSGLRHNQYFLEEDIRCESLVRSKGSV